jgi:hypothetical protein
MATPLRNRSNASAAMLSSVRAQHRSKQLTLAGFTTLISGSSPTERPRWRDGRLCSESRAFNDPKGESIYVGSLDGSSPKLIASKTSGTAAYAAGCLVYGQDHILWAQPFDLRRLEISGSPTSLTSRNWIRN